MVNHPSFTPQLLTIEQLEQVRLYLREHGELMSSLVTATTDSNLAGRSANWTYSPGCSCGALEGQRHYVGCALWKDEDGIPGSDKPLD